MNKWSVNRFLTFCNVKFDLLAWQSSQANYKVCLHLKFHTICCSDSMIKWTKDFCDRKRLKSSDVRIVLFNSHNDSLARKFIENKFPSLCLIESNQEKANFQKVCMF